MGVRRKRRKPESGEFEDPLKDYTGPEPQDELERSLTQGKVRDMKIEPFATVTADATVEQVMGRMTELNVACIMICEDERLLGIFSERDVLMRVAEQYDAVRERPIRDFMTPEPAVVYRPDSPAKALNMMAGAGFRHVPILDVDDKVVGILGPRRVTTYLRRHFGD